MNTQQQLIFRLNQLLSPEAHRPCMALAKVLEIADTDCVVQLLDSGLRVADVGLGAHASPQGFLCYPKKNSLVWVAWRAIDAAPVVIATEALARVRFAKGKTKVSLSESIHLRAQSHLRIENNTQSLGRILNDLLSMLTTLTVGTSAGPSTPPNLDTQTKITQLKTRVNTLFQ